MATKKTVEPEETKPLTTPVAKPKAQSYVVLRGIDLPSGDRYEAGDSITLPADRAARLLRMNAIKES